MALGSITRQYSVTLRVDAQGQWRASGDLAGGVQLPSLRELLELNDSGSGPAPTVAGWVYQSRLQLTAAMTIFIAHASDPFQAAGDAAYSDPSFSPAGKKAKILWWRAPNSNTANITVARASTQGFLGFAGASHGMVLSPGGQLLWSDPGGDVGGALTTASNDRFTITPASGTQEVDMLVVYGT